METATFYWTVTALLAVLAVTAVVVAFAVANMRHNLFIGLTTIVNLLDREPPLPTISKDLQLISEGISRVERRMANIEFRMKLIARTQEEIEAEEDEKTFGMSTFLRDQQNK